MEVKSDSDPFLGRISVKRKIYMEKLISETDHSEVGRRGERKGRSGESQLQLSSIKGLFSIIHRNTQNNAECHIQHCTSIKVLPQLLQKPFMQLAGKACL